MRKILVVIDPEETRHSALNRIREVPADTALFKVVCYLQGPSNAENACGFPKKIVARKRLLKSLVQPFRAAGYQVETDIKIFYRLYETIIQSAIDFRADFIFKPLRRHGALRRTLFTSTDWNLVRFCPCPLLLVCHANPIKGKPVMAAVDLMSQDDARGELNKVVLAQTKILSGVLNADMHLVHAYNPVTVPLGLSISDPSVCEITEGKKAEQFFKAQQLTLTCGIPEENFHLREGSAGEVVSRCAAEIDAGVIVVGTVARSGPAGLFIGNTAESVIEKASCDVFIVKQAGFESPIKALRKVVNLT